MEKIVKKHIEKILNKKIVLEKPKDISLGHFSTPIAFSLSKELKKSPMIIAKELVPKFDKEEIFKKVEAVKGFINFKLSNSFLQQLCEEALQLGENFAKGENKGKRILLEYVSANPTGPLHIGHTRGAVMGDTLARIGKHLGYDITTEYFVNDFGKQMELLGLSMAFLGKEKILHEEVSYPQTYYRGEYLFDIVKEAKDKFGAKIFNDESRYLELALFAKDKILDIIKKDLYDINIQFDEYVSEKSLFPLWEETKNVLEKNNALLYKDDKIWINSTKYGDDTNRVVVKDDKKPTYLAGDIIYHKNKFDRNYDKCINVWGADHHGHIPRIKASLEFLGNDSSKLEIWSTQMVRLLKDKKLFKISKRAGNVILLSDISKEIGSDALRFVFLSKKSDTHLEFNLDVLKKQDSSNPIFYINYAYARIIQVFKKSELTIDDIQNESFNGVNEDSLNLVYEALRCPWVLNEAFTKREIQKVTDYLQFLSASVHRFYNAHKVIGSKEEKSYLKILSLVALAIKTSLNLLGIKAKEVM